MKIALDIDGVINEYPAFFRLMSKALNQQAVIFVITNRDPESRESTAAELAHFGIYYDHLIITGDKAEFIIDNRVDVLFENTDEYFLKLPPTVCVCKVREPGNFNYETQRWVYGEKTGEQLYPRRLSNVKELQSPVTKPDVVRVKKVKERDAGDA